MKPKLSRQEVENLLRSKGVSDKVALVAIRGYYLDSLGEKNVNDRGIYDDAIFLISPRRFMAFRANTDPSIFRSGIATLLPGVHRYYKGKHKGLYWALRLVGETAPVTRDGQTGIKTGVALNIHKGGNRTTGSEGCQTLMPADWDDFIEATYDEMAFYSQETIPYFLLEETARRKSELTPHNVGQKIDEIRVSAANQKETVVSAPARIPQIPVEISPQIGTRIEAIQGEAILAAERFQPEDFTAYIPQITTAKSWLKTLLGLSGLGSIGAFFGGLPQWIVISLFILLILSVVGAIVIFVKYHDRVFEYVKAMNAMRATEGVHNPVVSGETPTS